MTSWLKELSVSRATGSMPAKQQHGLRAGRATTFSKQSDDAGSSARACQKKIVVVLAMFEFMILHSTEVLQPASSCPSGSTACNLQLAAIWQCRGDVVPTICIPGEGRGKLLPCLQ